MPRRLVPLLALGVLLFTASFALQKRVRPKGPAEFGPTLRAAGTAWEAGAYGRCIRELNTALGLATEKRSRSLREALPKAPEGWQSDPERKAETGNPFAAAMAASVGSIVERSYREKDGRGTISATLTADSPLVQMFTMWMANPALLGEGAELVEYEAHKAVLKRERQGWNLQILINGAHVCEVRGQNVTEEQLFALFDQGVVDRLAKVLGD